MRDTNPTPNTSGASPAGKSLGMGGEATEALHALEQQGDGGQPPDPGAASQQNAAPTGRGDDAGTGGTAGAPGAADRAGSEPLGRQREHVPSYGGMGGAPRVSSDQREPADPEGDANVGGGQGGPPPTPAYGQPGGQADESDPPYPTPT